MGKHDLDKYMPLVSSFEISDEHKRELLKSVWRIAQSFVDRAYCIDSAQISVQNQASETGQESSNSVYFPVSYMNENGLEGRRK